MVHSPDIDLIHLTTGLMTKTPIDQLRDIIRKLDATGDDGFEGLLAVVLTDVTKTTFSLAKSGSQRGKDGQSTFDPGTISFEGKRYDDTVPKNEVLSKIAEIAADDKGHADLWILGSTGTVRSQDVETITALGERLAIGTLILDWSSAGLPGLGTLLAMAADQSATFIADKTRVPEAEILKGLSVREPLRPPSLFLLPNLSEGYGIKYFRQFVFDVEMIAQRELGCAQE